MDCYCVMERIGRGAYANVFKGVHVDKPDQFVALKQILVSQKDSAQGMPQFILREVAMLKKLNMLQCPNIVRLYDVITDYSCTSSVSSSSPKSKQSLSSSANRDPSPSLSVTLVFELIPRSMLSYVENEAMITPQICKHLVLQTLQGLDFLHVNGVMHR